MYLAKSECLGSWSDFWNKLESDFERYSNRLVVGLWDKADKAVNEEVTGLVGPDNTTAYMVIGGAVLAAALLFRK